MNLVDSCEEEAVTLNAEEAATTRNGDFNLEGRVGRLECEMGIPCKKGQEREEAMDSPM